MTVNWQVFITAVAIGALAELITMKYPGDIFRRSVGAFKVLLIALVIALIPPDQQWAIPAAVLIGLVVARIGDVVGELMYSAVVKIAIVLDERKWRIDQNDTEESHEQQTTISE